MSPAFASLYYVLLVAVITRLVAALFALILTLSDPFSHYTTA